MCACVPSKRPQTPSFDILSSFCSSSICFTTKLAEAARKLSFARFDHIFTLYYPALVGTNTQAEVQYACVLKIFAGSQETGVYEIIVQGHNTTICLREDPQLCYHFTCYVHLRSGPSFVGGRARGAWSRVIATSTHSIIMNDVIRVQNSKFTSSFPLCSHPYKLLLSLHGLP